MKKLLLLLPMLATISLYSMDNNTHQCIHEKLRQKAGQVPEEYQNEMLELLKLYCNTQGMEYPYKDALNKKPLTWKQHLAEMGYERIVHYETGETIAEFLPTKK